VQAVALPALLLAALTGFAQNQPISNESNPQPANPQEMLTIPPGTHLPLVLTQPIQTRHVRRGDDIYAQVTSPVDAADQVAIPAGTFVQGTVDKIDRHNGRGEVHLQSMSITFPDGYIARIAGPITIQSDEGYALKDPGSKRGIFALVLPAAGLGFGALIGHAAANPQPQTITSTLPPGCTGPPPECLSSSVTAPGNAGKSTAIGAAIGGAIGGGAAIAVLLSSHHFFLDVGTPMDVTLQHPIALQQKEVSRAVQQSAQETVAVQPVAPIPVPPPTVDHGTCYTPGTPGTPSTVIPGAVGADGIPGPPTIIPGTPPTPGTPYPCP
jgi:hypothetical protein